MVKYEDHLDIDRVMMYIESCLLEVDDKYDLRKLVGRIWSDGWESGYREGYDEGRSDGFEDDLK